MIYLMCYYPPYPESYTTVDQSNTVATTKKGKTERRKKTGHSKVQRNAVRCNRPLSHLSLGQVCQQIRNEYYPILADSHVFHFAKPLEFANNYLAYMPSHRVQTLRHISLGWTLDLQDHWSRQHVSSLVDAAGDIRNLIMVLNNYNELARHLTSIRLQLMVRPTSFTPGTGLLMHGTYKFEVAMIKGAFRIVEVMDRILLEGSTERRYFLTTPRFVAHDTEITIWGVPKELWANITNGEILCKDHCEDCVRYYKGGAVSRCYLHHPRVTCFTDASEIADAFNSRRMYRRSDHPEQMILNGTNANWKVVFHPVEFRHTWDSAMREMQQEKDAALRSTKKRKRQIEG